MALFPTCHECCTQSQLCCWYISTPVRHVTVLAFADLQGGFGPQVIMKSCEGVGECTVCEEGQRNCGKISVHRSDCNSRSDHLLGIANCPNCIAFSIMLTWSTCKISKPVNVPFQCSQGTTYCRIPRLHLVDLFVDVGTFLQPHRTDLLGRKNSSEVDVSMAQEFSDQHQYLHQ